MFSSKTLKKIQAALIFLIVCSSIAFSAQLVIDQVGVYTTPQAMIQAIDDNFDELYARWTSLVDDTTPQLGGDLDLNTHSITGMVIGTNIQAYDADLTTWAGITPGSNVGTFLATPSSANFFSAISDEGAYASTLFGLSAATGLPIGDTAFTDLSNGSTYTNFGIAGDDTIDELFAAIDTAIGGLAGGHDAVTLDASLSSIFNLGGAQVLTLTGWPTFNQNTTGTAGGLSGTPNITVGTISSGAITATGTVTAPSFASSAADGSRISYLPENSNGNEPTPTAGYSGVYFYDGTFKFFEDYASAADVFTLSQLVNPTLGIGVETALGINIGSAGAPVLFNGAGGTPSSLTLTNATGLPAAGLGTDADDDAIEFVIDGGGTAITTGVKGFLEVPFACTISSATALADQSGSIVVDLWVDSYANYPPTDADSITASTPVTISTATASQDTTLTSWTASLTKGQIIGFNVDSATTVERVTISLKVDK